MSLLLVSKKRDFTSLKNALLKEDPNLDVEIWPKVERKERVNFAVCWNHPEHVLDSYPNLRAVSSLGAGVNHLLNDESLDENTPICRLITDSLKEQMADYVLNAVTNYRLHIPTFVDNKRVGKWEQMYAVPKSKITVGVMGLGEMGTPTAEHLVKNGYEVNGWSRSKKEIEGVRTYAGNNELGDFLSATNVLVCLLPLTPETDEILDLELFKQLKKPAYLINVGRGQHLVEEDVIYALETEDLSGACLDVFQEEPLPNNHIFWNRSKIMITPHIAAVTPAKQAAKILVENYKRALSGMELIHEVDRDAGY